MYDSPLKKQKDYKKRDIFIAFLRIRCIFLFCDGAFFIQSPIQKNVDSNLNRTFLCCIAQV